VTTDTAENPCWVVQISTTICDGTDTIGAITEAVPGPSAFQLGNVAGVFDANRLDLEGAARELLAQRATRLAEVTP
jgi:transketolase N-terminal domain/subunit